MTLNIRIASASDAEEIAALVNRAYRPHEGIAGWTHEANLMAGKRISAEQVLALFRDGSAVLLLCQDEKIVACVHVEAGAPHAYIGMLTTEPELQAKGYGKHILEHAEKHAREQFGCSVLKMSVLSRRPELLAFYERRGYALTGETAAFPLDAGVGQPLNEDIVLLSLAKQAG